MRAPAKQQSNNKFNKSYAYYRKFATSIGVFFLSFFIAGTLSPVLPSGAITCEDGSTGTSGQVCDIAGTSVTVNIENPYFISVTSSAGSGSGIVLDYTASNKNLGNVIAASDTVTTASNTGMAKHLYISTTSSTSNDLTNSETDLTDDKTYIAAGGGNTISSASALSDNTWGFALPSGTVGIPTNTFDNSYTEVSSTSKFAKVPTLGNDILVQRDIGVQAAGSGDYISTADIYYGTLVTMDIYAGSYSNTIRYTAFTDEPPITINDIKYMQEMTTSICDKMSTADTSGNNIYTLSDIRDDKTYKIAKLADNNCWMVQNLAYDGGIMTPSDSNVTQNRDISGAVIENGTASYAHLSQIYAGDQLKTTQPDDGMPYGNYYNSKTASANTVSTGTTLTVFYESVCPRNWRLPDVSSSDSKSFPGLLKAYGLPTSNTNNQTAANTVQKAPLFFPAAGWYLSGTKQQGESGWYWTRNPYKYFDTDTVANTIYGFYFNSINPYKFHPKAIDYSNVYVGHSVRCVLGE